MHKKILVTGGAGFIGSHLVERLLKENNKVIVLDNLSSGKKDTIQEHFNNPDFSFCRIDLVRDQITSYFEGVNEVWHMAANSDVRAGNKDTKIDIEQNTIATYNILEAMRKNDVRNLCFASTSTVYGDAKETPTPEDYSPLEPISLYGASKLTCEALISAYCHNFKMKAVVFRLANVIGSRSSHGVIHDFIEKLKKNEHELEMFGNGKQNKSYIHIEDCIEAMLFARNRSAKPFDVFNIGSDDQIRVVRIAEIISEEMGLNPRFKFTGGTRGWVGDVPEMILSIKKLKRIGWEPKHNSEEAVKKAVKRCLDYGYT